MNGSNMIDLIEFYYDEIVADYIYPKNAKDDPEVENTDYFKDPDFYTFAESWVNDHEVGQNEMAYDAWKERDGKADSN